jgi:predicted ATPase/DNA-binding winged helix-turn-helix (wHTH) protein/Tfp pilus assembly protein PilF
MRKLYEIGVLRLDPEASVLTKDGAPVALGARGAAVLTALVSRANEYVPKAEIMDAAWPGLVVEEANLAVQISAIRRLLAQVPGGEGWIETLARRGYRFVGPVVVIAGGKPEAPVSVDRKRSNLPQVLTSFVGREREIAEIKRLLPTTRLLTLTGTGGIGKTRLAVQAAAEVLDAYRDGVWFVDLAPLTDPSLVPNALAQVLGVKESAGQPLLRTLCDHLRAKELLLVLDNCEHLLGASADLVDALLRDTAQVNVVATSRESLRVAAERTYPLNVLPLPDPKTAVASIARSDAVQLFVDRARQYRPHFDLQEQRAGAVAAICVQLDGIPLALELAAARVAVLPVEQIVRLLDQRFRLLTSGNRELPRHQTLRAMLDWSYELLDEPEQQLFAKLSVFAGGWTIAAAEAIGAGESIAKDDVVYLLIALIEKSLVVADEDGDRYRMLETVREYARDRLTESGSAEVVRERHRDFFLALAERAEPKLLNADQAEWLRRLEVEHGNLRAAIHWSLAEAGSGGALRLCGALQQFWWMRGYLMEGREWCTRALDRPDVERRTPERAKALNGAGTLAYMQSDYSAARDYYEESLALRRYLDDRSGMAAALNNLGLVACEQGDLATAKSLIEQSLPMVRELGDRSRIAAALSNLGMVALTQRDFILAQAQCEESMVIYRELGDQSGVATSLSNLGNVASGLGDNSTARTLQNESLAIRRDLDDRWGIATCLTNLGNLASNDGDYASARTMFEDNLAIARDLGEIQGIVFALGGLAGVIAALGGPAPAARIWGAVERLREEAGSPLLPDDRLHHDRLVATARAALGDDAAFDRAWQEGRALTPEQAMELAMEKSSSRTQAHD